MHIYMYTYTQGLYIYIHMQYIQDSMAKPTSMHDGTVKKKSANILDGWQLCSLTKDINFTAWLVFLPTGNRKNSLSQTGVMYHVCTSTHMCANK